MRNEKAEKYLSENILGYPYTGYVTEQVAERAIELAEQEAEERMRKKATDAFISCCHCVLPQYVRNKCKTCESYKSFIQKLNEE